MNIARLILRYRRNQIHRRYAHLGYEIRPRRIAMAYALLVKPEWVRKVYTSQAGARVSVICRFANGALLADTLLRVLQTVESREYIHDRDKVASGTFNKTIDTWLMTETHRDIDPAVLVDVLVKNIPALCRSIDECQLARKDMYEYYERQTTAIMEDSIVFLGAILDLKLNK